MGAGVSQSIVQHIIYISNFFYKTVLCLIHFNFVWRYLIHMFIIIYFIKTFKTPNHIFKQLTDLLTSHTFLSSF